MTEQLTLKGRGLLVRREKLEADVARLLFALKEAPKTVDGWVGVMLLTQKLGTNKRGVRALAEASGGKVISRTHNGGGYKLTLDATPAETTRAVRSRYARARAETLVAVQIGKVFHNAGRFLEPIPDDEVVTMKEPAP